MEVRVQGHIELVFFLVLITMMSLVGGDDGAMKNKARTTFTSKQSPDLGPNGRTFSETDGLDNKISAFLRDKHYTGATIGIARRDEVLYTQGYGHLDDDIQMTPTNLLPISSLSKTITAVAILKLVENGDLKLTDPVFGPDGILSSFKPPKKKDMDPRLLNIMVGHLLHHTAGWSQTRPQLHDPMMNSVYLSRGHNVTDIATEMNLGHDLSPNDVITYMMRQPLDHPPGMKYEYSNFGYSVLGRVIEHISGKRYVSFIRSEILKPLGMWHTRLGPHSSVQMRHNNHIPVINFFEGDIPLSDIRRETLQKSYTLLDSTLGWWSTTYDLMRFVTGLTSGIVLNATTLELLTKHPSAPVSEHRDTWHGLGVQANEDGGWWQIGDPHDNEIILFHQKSPTQAKSKQLRFKKPRQNSCSWVVILSDNNRKNLRQVFGQMISTHTQWPVDNLLIEDCSEYPVRMGHEHSTLMNSHISESHFPMFLNAASRLFYYPVWISAYNIKQKTYMAAVLKRDTENIYKVTHGVTKADLINLRMENLIDGMYLNFLTSYISHQSNDDTRYTAIFSETPSQSTQFGIGETFTEFQASINEEKGHHMPNTQSVVSINGVRYFTYSLSDKEVYHWKRYDNLTLDQLELQIRTNAKKDKVLLYLDSYTHLGEVLFSAIFGRSKAGKWQVQTKIQQSVLLSQSSIYQGLHFRPNIVVGYACKGKPCFIIMWTKK